MASSKDKPDSKRVMDVSKPGKAAPDSSGRPIIVGHKPMITDPMVNADAEENDSKESQTDIKVRVGGEKVVLPPGQNKEEAVTADETKPAKAEQKPDKEDASDNKPATSEAAVVDAIAAQATAKKKDNEASSQDKKRVELVEKLIQDKTYYVPIGQIKQRKTRRNLAAGFVLMLAAGGTAAAVDAGMLDIGVQLPFDLIK